MYRTTVAILVGILLGNFSYGKTIVIGEQIIEANPWRNGLIRKQIEIAAGTAMENHRKEFPKSDVSIIKAFDASTEKGFLQAKAEEALAVIGYVYSSEATEAAQLANKYKIPYLSPVSPMASIRGEYSASLANCHGQLRDRLKRMDGAQEPSIVVVPTTHLTNLEYAKIYQESFNVVATFEGSAEEIWSGLVAKIASLRQVSRINVLFAGYSMEQAELLPRLSRLPEAKRLRFFGHDQWYFSPKAYRVGDFDRVENFFVLSGAFDPFDLRSAGLLTGDSYRFDEREYLRKKLEAAPDHQGYDIHEPVVYALYDLMRSSLRLAERSGSSEEFNHWRKNFSFSGVSGSYQFEGGTLHRKVYLGKWNGRKLLPIRAL